MCSPGKVRPEETGVTMFSNALHPFLFLCSHWGPAGFRALLVSILRTEKIFENKGKNLLVEFSSVWRFSWRRPVWKGYQTSGKTRYLKTARLSNWGSVGYTHLTGCQSMKLLQEADNHPVWLSPIDFFFILFSKADHGLKRPHRNVCNAVMLLL